MPEASARSPDGDGLFTASVLQWLRRQGCRGVHPLGDGDGLGDTDAPVWTTVAAGPQKAATRGWRFGWRDAAGARRALLLDFAEPDQLPDASRAALAAYLHLAGRCLGDAPGSAHLLDRTDASQKIHDLRNGLNSLLMNVAVLTTKLAPADREGRFAMQVQADGERCAALLQSLNDAIRPPDGPPGR